MGNYAHRLGAVDGNFIIFAQPSRVRKPGESALNTPSFGENMKFARLDFLRYFASQVAAFHKIFECAAVAGVGADALNRWEFSRRDVEW